MTFNQDILNDLVCIDCKNDLEYIKESELLRCKHCHREYAIIDGIPMMGGIDDRVDDSGVYEK